MKNKFKIISFVTLLLFLLSVAINNEPTNQINQTQILNEDILARTSGPSFDKFIVGVQSGPNELDPLMAWDSDSYNVIDQVCEGLFWYNFSTPESEIIPVLAASEGTWSNDGLNYTIPLRTGVFFHDGTKFNSSAVKFTFDRLLYLTNATGTLPLTTQVSIVESIYKFSNGIPIINEVLIIDEYTVRFILNDKYGALLALLTFEPSFIVSPESTPALDYIDTYTGDLVGTGPFVYDNYNDSVEVNFHTFDNYWRGAANFTEMQFIVIQDSLTRQNALLSGDIHFLDGIMTSMIPTFKSDSNIAVIDDGKTEAIFYYLCMNNNRINKTWRQAVSYAINYTYIIKELQQNLVAKLKSPLPEGVLYSNSTLDYAVLNVTKARLLLQSMGFGTGFSLDNDAEWVNVANGPTPFASWNYSYNIGNSFREDLYVLLADNLAKIGIQIINDGMSWMDFILRAYGLEPGGYDTLHLFWMGWGLDFNDPSQVFNLVLSSAAQYNSAQVNDPYLDNLIDLGLEEYDPTLRKSIYNDIQQYLVEDLMPWALGYSPKLYTAHHVNITGYQQNSFERNFFYTIHGDFTEPEPEPVITKVYIDDADPLYDWNKTESENDWCTGSGTLEDPYIIKDLIIDGAKSGIIIQNSSVYFEIINCTIINGGVDYGDAAIQLTNVALGKIIGNNLTNNLWYGISLVDCYNCTIFGNFLENGYYGITAQPGQNLNITNNSMFNIIIGVAFDGNCFENTVVNNTIICDDSIIGPTLGISPGGRDHVFRNNKMENCGVFFFYFNNIDDLTTYDMDSSNEINGKPLYYYKNQINLIPNDFLNAGQVILVNCNNSLISNLDLSHSTVGFSLYGCNYNNLSNINIHDQYAYGLVMYQSSNNLIEKCEFSNDKQFGIYCYSESSSNTFETSIISDNFNGIYLESSNNTVHSNIISNNSQVGLYTGWETHDNVMYNNSFIDNMINAQEGGTNHWDNGALGNYWDDYTGVDANDDGIGDSPYQIPDSSSIDNFPIWDDGPGVPSTNFWILTPFTIDDDGYGDYTWLEVVNEEWCQGSGTLNDPYVIENVIINGQDNRTSCITIRNSNVYFVIRNCTLFNTSQSGAYYAGIYLEHVENGFLIGNYISDNVASGVYLDQSDNNVISNNTFIDTIFFVYTTYSNNITISGNKVIGGELRINYGNFNEISNNLLENSFFYIENGDNNLILNNNITNNWNAINLASCENNILTGNLLSGSGLILYGSLQEKASHTIDTSNLVNGKPLYYYTNETSLGPSDFTNAGQVILINCYECLISGLIISQSSNGISIHNSGNIEILDNNLSFNTEIGIYLYSTSMVNISGNTIKNNLHGIALYDCTNITISENIIDNNGIFDYDGRGVYLWKSDYNTISNNEIKGNLQLGIHLEGSSFNKVFANYIEDNRYGIQLSRYQPTDTYSNFNEFYDNEISNHNSYGFFISIGQQNNIAYQNLFINNIQNARDDGTNAWNNTIIGNYWDDYPGVDADDDGIGDTPYYLTSLLGGIDYLPIWDDGPEIPGPSYWILSPFIIDNNGYGDYTWGEAALEDWCSGTGTQADPYIIENVFIDGEGADYCISIRNSFVYFVLKNCTFINAYNGVDLNIVVFGTLLEGNYSNNFGFGVNLYGCGLILISDNIIQNNTYNGINLSNTNSSSFVNNQINYNLQIGINSHESNFNNYSGNILRDNTMAALSIQGILNTFSNNLMYGTGLLIFPDSIEYYTTEDVDTTNLLNDKPVYFYANEIGLGNDDFVNAGQILLYNCSESLISNLELIDAVIGVYMVNCNNNVISNNSISNGIVGIYLIDSHINEIYQNNITYQINGGIYLSRSNFTSIVDNNIENTQIGITISESGIGVISENTIAYNMQGIYIQGTDYLIYLNNFIQNTEHAVNYGVRNDWDNGTIGNYWDDYDGVDANNDGIGDTPYLIAGEPGNVDNYPIWDDGLTEDDIAPLIVINKYNEYVLFGTGAFFIEAFITDNVQLDLPIIIEFYYPNGTFINSFDMILNISDSSDTYFYYWLVDSLPVLDNYYFIIIANDTSSNLAQASEYFNIVTEIPTHGYWILSPFIIDDDGYGDYTWAEAAAEEWCRGSGTWNDPYIIENVIMNCNGSETGIHIRNSNVYFILKNCTVYNAGQEEYYPGDGIRLDYVRNGALLENNCSFNTYTGISLMNSFNISIINNIVNENGQSGISSYNSNSSQYIGNYLNDNFLCGLYIHGQYNTFSDNLMYGSGFLIFPESMPFYTTTDVGTSNLFNDKTVYFYSNEVGLGSGDFINAGQILLYNCSYSSISNLNLTGATISIYMVSCNSNSIHDNSLSDGLYAIYLWQSNSNEISNNDVTRQSYGGIFLYESNFTSIVGNNIENNTYYGISIHHSREGLIAGNTISLNQEGIYLYESSNYWIFLNNFIQNTNRHAEDYGFNNNWDNGTIGNYWDDYTGADYDDDGIGDTPYLITGDPGSVDNFPIWDDGPGAPDDTPPITSITLDGIIGDNGWYVSEVLITLNATDDISGVDIIEYSYDSINWITYTGPFTISTEGNHTIFYRSIDNNGNIEDYSVEEFKIDLYEPITTLILDGTLGNNGWYVFNVTFAFIAHDSMSGVYKTEFSTDGVHWTEFIAGLNWSEYIGPYPINSEGVLTFYYRSIDKAGNTEDIKTETIQIDRTAPTTWIIEDGVWGENGWFVSDLLINFSVIDVLSGLDYSEYSFDGVSWITYTETISIVNENITALYYRSIDIAGNIESTKVYYALIDKSEPTSSIHLDGVVGNNNWYISTVNIEINATDGISGIDLIQYSFNGINWITYSGTFLISDEGINNLYYRAIDKAGLIEPAQMVSFKIETTPPVTVAYLQGNLSSYGWWNSDVIVSMEVNESVSGLLYTEYSYDEITWNLYTSPFIVSNEGVHIIRYRSVSVAGLIETYDAVLIRIDKHAPNTTISLTGTMINDDWYLGNVQITLTSTDTLSGVIETQYSLDGINWITYTGPFNIPEIGEITLYYRSIDLADNIEPMKSIIFRILTLPIIIDDLGYGDFTWEEAADEGLCSGTGTLNDPYIIEDFILSEYTGWFIEVRNSIAYFIVRNCSDSFSIYFENVSNGIVSNNIFRGVSIESCDNIKVTDNILDAGSFYIFYTNYSEFTGNTFNQATSESILLTECYYNEFSSNLLYGMGYGEAIRAEGPNNYNEFINNTIANFGIGLFMEGYCDYNIICHNTIFNQVHSGIYLDACDYNFVAENIIFDIECYNNPEWGEIAPYAGLTLFDSDFNEIINNQISGCDGNGINLLVSNHPFCTNNSIIGNLISNCGLNGIFLRDSLFTSITDNTLVELSSPFWYYGSIKMLNTNNTLILRNNCSNNSGNGIYLANCDNNLISENTFQDVYRGIQVDGPANYNDITYNQFIRNIDGVYMQDVENYNIKYNNFIVNRDQSIQIYTGKNINISENYFYGSGEVLFIVYMDNSIVSDNIFLADDTIITSAVITFQDCKYNEISGNLIYGNVGDGIRFESGNEFNVIVNNTITDSYWGVFMEDCNYNTVSYNNISYNYEAGIFLSGSNDNLISNNILHNNTVIAPWFNLRAGIVIEGSHRNIIENNEISNTFEGISIKDGNNNHIMENTIINNIGNGIWIQLGNNITIERNTILKNGEGGISIFGDEESYCFNTMILENTIEGIASFNGIWMSFCQNGVMVNNIISSFGSCGFYIQSCQFLNITKNEMFNNDENAVCVIESTNIIISKNIAVDHENSGIYLDNCNMCIISENNVVEAIEGIRIDRSMGNSIIDNNISNCSWEGILILQGNNNTIERNTILNNGARGIYIIGDEEILSSFNVVCENIIENNVGTGIRIEFCQNSNISENIMINNEGLGITLYYCHDIEALENTINDNNEAGIAVEFSNRITVSNNEINQDNPNGGISLYQSNNNIILKNYINGQISIFGIKVRDGDLNTLSNNTIKNCQLGIYLDDCWNNSIVSNNITNIITSGITLYLCSDCYISKNILVRGGFEDEGNGIEISHSDNNIISGNVVRDNFDSGILLTQSDYNSIINNSVYENLGHLNGIYLSWSDNNIISGNFVKNNSIDGICLTESSYNVISFNIITENYDIGIHLEGGFNNSIIKNIISRNFNEGISLEESVNNIISGNIISHNAWDGITICSDSSNNVISGNYLINNNFTGIYFEFETINNLIYENYFIGNLEGNARDDGVNNTWDNGAIGNYWDDYTGVDDNDDGIGDTPYYIPGEAGSIDRYPIWDDGTGITNPIEYLEIVISMLEELEVPCKARCFINIAIKKLYKAIDWFEEAEFYKAFNKIKIAVKNLMDAQEFGAETQEIIDALIELVQFMADKAINEATDMVGADNKFVIKAQEHYSTALVKLSIGKYHKAVKFFKRAYKNAMKARCQWIDEGYIDDLLDRLDDIRDIILLTTDPDALNALYSAETKMLIAIEKANNSLLEASFYRLEKVINFLFEAEDYGVETFPIICLIMENIDDVVYLKIVDAENALYGLSSEAIEKAWIKYYKAKELWDELLYHKAIDKYVRAVELIIEALL